MSTEGKGKCARTSDVEILRRWAEPNHARIHLLLRDGFTCEEATEYDLLERREAALLDLYEERGLTEEEEDELAALQERLAAMHREATGEEAGDAAKKVNAQEKPATPVRSTLCYRASPATLPGRLELPEKGLPAILELLASSETTASQHKCKTSRP